MNIFYDVSSENWCHNQENIQLYAGASNEEIPFKEDHQQQKLVPITLFPGNRVLIVGILTSLDQKKESGIGGNLTLFQNLSLYLSNHGILGYVFTSESLLSDCMKGFIFDSETSSWEEVTVPLPDIVYNRIPKRGFEASPEFQQLITFFKEHRIHLFNPCFLDKYLMYEALTEDGSLARHLPSTIDLSEPKQLSDFFHFHKHIYLKPCKGSQGKGIYTLLEKPDGTLQFSSLKHIESYPDFSAFWDTNKAPLLKRGYLAQRAVIPKKLNGHRYDYRILVHYENGFYKVTGKGVRMSQTQEITTHTPRGGKLFPYQHLQTRKLNRKLSDIAQRCGIILSRKFGFLGEFSIDIGEDTSGTLFIYEVNSKPMQFDEEEIEANRLLHLKNLFIELTFPNQIRK